MSIALEIITDSGSSVDLDPWCQFAKIEGRKLIGNMQFGTVVIGTDSEEIVALKKQEAAEDCDKFFDAIEPYAGKQVTVIYDAVSVATVLIPENGGLNTSGDLIEWEVVPDSAESIRTSPVAERENFDTDSELATEELIAVIRELTASVQKLTKAIDGKRQK